MAIELTPSELLQLEIHRQNRAKEVAMNLPAVPDSIGGALKALETTLKSTRIVPDTEAVSRARKLKVDELKANWNAPARHLALDEYDQSATGWLKQLELFRQLLGTGFTCALIGTRGPGKTQMGVELMRHNVERRLKSARFSTATEIFLDLKSTFVDGARRPERDVVGDYVRPHLLVIDEVQERGESAWEDRMLTDLINRRYNHLKDTLLIANLKRDEFERSLGASIMSRLKETGGIIEATWKSFR